MKKSFLLVILLSVLYPTLAQNIIISFQPKENVNAIDSIYATNLRTNEMVKLMGNDSLSLVKNLTYLNDFPYKPELGNIFPNPSDFNSTLSFSITRSQDVEIGLYNSSGQLLTRKIQSLETGTHQFILKFPVAGIYYITVSKKDGLSSFKAIYTGRKIQSSSISYLGSQKIISQNIDLNFFKSAKIAKELVYLKGDVILYNFYSGKNTTVFADKPIESKTIEVEFVSCIDFDNKSYKAVKIGTQWWMAENLAYLPAVSPPSTGSDTASYYYVYDYSGSDIAIAKSTNNYSTYGVLYNWPAAKESCPLGWHLPSDDEWKQLELTLGMTQQQANTIGWRGTDQGKQMKTTYGWNNNANASNSSGFSALPAGYRYSNGNFMHIGGDGCWWTSTDFSTNEPWFHFVSYGYSKVHRNHNYDFRKYAWSVRCVRD
jgi:uncharacterized protein (TIGR02145 family)